MTDGPRRHLLLCAPAIAVDALGELVAAWRDDAVDVEIRTYDGEPPNLAALIANTASPPDAALLVGSVRRAPATVLPGPFALTRGGPRVPVGWLPVRDLSAVRRFASVAARVRRRAQSRRALALFGQWLPNYLRVTDRMRIIAGDGGLRAFRWTGDAITRESMLDAVGCGVGLGLYVGHGRAMGWVGYHGVRSHHFDGGIVAGDAQDNPPPEPMGAMLSLCCRTASRRRVGLSFTEALPLLGVAAASFGSIGDTLHTDNTRWAVGVCTALAAGASTVGDLLVRAAPTSPASLASYRLIGDPLAPIGCDDAAVTRAERIRTFESTRMPAMPRVEEHVA